MSVTCIAPTADRTGEGLIWSPEESAVYWTDINRFLIHRHDEISASTRSWFFDEPVVALSLTTEPGRLMVALGSKLIWWWPATDQRLDHGFHLAAAPVARLNDGRADPQGNFWIGSMKNNVGPNGEGGEAGKGHGALYRIAPDGTVTEWLSGLGIANTLCWSPDATLFYFADTLENRVSVYDYDGGISNGRVFFEGFARGAPDGSAIDAEGHLWNCRWGGGCVVRVAPDGRISGMIEMPAPNVTTAAFGGADRRRLFITTAAADTPPAHRLAGSLFAIDCDVPGLPENRVRV